MENKQDNQDEMNQIQGGIEAEMDKRQEILDEIAEKKIVEQNLISKFVPIIVKICQETVACDMTQSSLLERTAMLTLSKLMCISRAFCQKHIDLFIQILEKPKADPVIKNNILITLGDLLHRHPIILERYGSNLYQCMRDENSGVRKTSLMVITHLFLNDMLKSKVEMSNIAYLFVDSDIAVENQAKLFFHEVNKKDPKTIRNLLPNFISRLSSSEEEGGVDESIFQVFAKEIVQYLEKDKNSEPLVESLC